MSDDGLDIVFTADVTAVMGDLSSLARMMRPLQQVADQTKAVGKGMSGAADQTQRMAAQMKQATGPAQQLTRALMNLRNAQQSGTATQRFDAQYQALRAQQAYGRAQQQMSPQPQGNAFASILKNAIFSTRFGVGSGGFNVMPLVGRMVQLLGRSGPIGAAAAVGAAAVMLLAEAADAAAKTINSLRAAQLSSGATYGETAQAAGLGALLGTDAKGVAGMSRALAQKLATDPYAMLYGARAGVRNPLGNTPFGAQDEMQQFLKMTRAIIEAPDVRSARRMARATGMEDVLPLRDADPRLVRQVLDSMKDSFSPQTVREAANLRAQEALLGLEFEKLKLQLGSAAMPAFMDALKVIQTAFEGIGYVLNFVRMSLWNALLPLRILVAVLEWAWDKIQRALGGGQSFAGSGTPHADDPAGKRKAPEDRLRQAIEDQTQATLDQIATMKGIFGGGERARGAIPGKLGIHLNDEATRQAIRLGAFAL